MASAVLAGCTTWTVAYNSGRVAGGESLQRVMSFELMVSQEFTTAMELGGTLSGEHGVCMLKRPYIPRARGSVSLSRYKSPFNTFWTPSTS